VEAGILQAVLRAMVLSELPDASLRLKAKTRTKSVAIESDEEETCLEVVSFRRATRILKTLTVSLLLREHKVISESGKERKASCSISGAASGD